MALCRRLPKVELHAHLHGSARLCTIADLAPPGVDQALLTSDTERSLEGCFAIFGAIHRTVTTLAAVRRITAEVLSDFAKFGHLPQSSVRILSHGSSALIRECTFVNIH